MNNSNNRKRSYDDVMTEDNYIRQQEKRQEEEMKKQQKEIDEYYKGLNQRVDFKYKKIGGSRRKMSKRKRKIPRHKHTRRIRRHK
jgi:uncharacterized FlaG/YvyC family protein